MPGHKSFLTRLIWDVKLKAINNRTRKSNEFCCFWLLGTASRTAPHTHNQGLSEERARAVRRYLRDGLSQSAPYVIRDSGLSETVATLKGKADEVEDPLDRSVLLVAQWYSVQTPKPPVIVRPKLKKYKTFKIRAVWAISDSIKAPGIKIGVKWVDMDLEILDVETNEVATYDWAGAGPSAKIGISGDKKPLGGKGRWHSFTSRTLGDRRADSFAGTAILDTTTPFAGTSFSFGGPDIRRPLRAMYEISDFDTGLPKDGITIAEKTTIIAEMKLRGMQRRR
jgi:hypothetical protein